MKTQSSNTRMHTIGRVAESLPVLTRWRVLMSLGLLANLLLPFLGCAAHYGHRRSHRGPVVVVDASVPDAVVVAKDRHHLTVAEIGRVKALAFQMEIDTDEAYIESAKAANPGNSVEQEALHGLYGLRGSAERFHEQVQRYSTQPIETTSAFFQLNTDFIKARDGFRRLTAYHGHQSLFETIVDTMGNLRFYYIASGAYEIYPDYAVYPYYPGHPSFVHIYVATQPYHYRYPVYWHLHPEHHARFPYRAEYHYGYGRYKVHFSSYYHYTWHKSKYADRWYRVPARNRRR